MSNQVVSVSPDTPLKRVWQLIFNKHVHGLPVVDKQKKLLGMISEADLLEQLFPGVENIEETMLSGEDDSDVSDKLEKEKKWKAEKVMNTHIFFTRPETNIMRALSRMIVRKVRTLPVLDDDNRIVGMISKGDIFDSLFKRKRQ